MHCSIFFSYELDWNNYVCLNLLFRSVWFVSSMIGKALGSLEQLSETRETLRCNDLSSALIESSSIIQSSESMSWYSPKLANFAVLSALGPLIVAK